MRDQESGEQAPDRPPGQFIDERLESDCARFLEDVRKLAERRAQQRELDEAD